MRPVTNAAETTDTAPKKRPGRKPAAVSLAEAAATLNRHPGTVRRMAARGELTAAEPPAGGRGLYLTLTSVRGAIKADKRRKKTATPGRGA